MAAPVIETIRPGVAFARPAAASWRRCEADLGRRIQTNSTTRDYALQLKMHNASVAYARGVGRYPGHSYAIHPDLSKHCRGEAADSNEWTSASFNTFMAERGWIRTAASDPTERHHYEYQSWRDQHINRPAGVGAVPIPEPVPEPIPEDDMELIYIRFMMPGGKVDPDPKAVIGSINHRFTSAGERSHFFNIWGRSPETARSPRVHISFLDTDAAFIDSIMNAHTKP